jgi:hypothetical protein
MTARHAATRPAQAAASNKPPQNEANVTNDARKELKDNG